MPEARELWKCGFAYANMPKRLSGIARSFNWSQSISLLSAFFFVVFNKKKKIFSFLFLFLMQICVKGVNARKKRDDTGVKCEARRGSADSEYIDGEQGHARWGRGLRVGLPRHAAASSAARRKVNRKRREKRAVANVTFRTVTVLTTVST